MSGGISGVQKRIKEKAHFAYVLCYGHKLILVLASVANNVPQASELFSFLEEVNIFASDAVVHEKFLSIQREMFPEEQIRELQHLSDTRWWCRATSCEKALLHLECIIRLLKETSADDTGARAVSARGLLAQMDAEFVSLLQFFSEILGEINKVSQQLQDKQADLGKAAKLISCPREDLADVRNSKLIENYSNRVEELGKKCDISPTVTTNRSRKHRQLRDFIMLDTTGQRVVEPSHAQHVIILHEVLDCLNSELERRFSKDSCVIFCGISPLCPAGQTFLHEDDLKSFALSYSVNQSDLKHELPLVKKLLQKEPQPPTYIISRVFVVYSSI
ncbi:uncharacterized protein LOC135203389 [Macrobrachium nipponense]|uniref:uncharacterized protein LOC135203389 n=1 Tax=Macrobrachium nipponense TaxID=159736 RepID=UPI0030C8C3BE